MLWQNSSILMVGIVPRNSTMSQPSTLWLESLFLWKPHIPDIWSWLNCCGYS